MSGLIGRTAAWAAGHLGQDDMAARFAADAARDRQAVEALRERYRQDPSLKYDPNAQTGFLVGEYGRPIASGIRGIGMLAKAGRLLAKRLR